MDPIKISVCADESESAPSTASTMTQSDREESSIQRPTGYGYCDEVVVDFPSNSEEEDEEEYVMDQENNGYHCDRGELEEDSDVDGYDEIYRESFREDFEEPYDELLDEDYCDDDENDENNSDMDLSTKSFAEPRLDSFDSYIVVSVLTATASFAALLDDNPEGAKSLTQRPMGRNAAILICAICSLSGIYSTVVFSFSSIYGRTAIGMGKYEACESFLEATASMRKKAFFSYLTSLVLFIVLLIIAAVDKIDPQLELPFVVLLVLLAGLVYRDWSHIIVAAGVIFAPPPKRCQERSHGMKLRSHSNGTKNNNVVENESLLGTKCKQS